MNKPIQSSRLQELLREARAMKASEEQAPIVPTPNEVSDTPLITTINRELSEQPAKTKLELLREKIAAAKEHKQHPKEIRQPAAIIPQTDGTTLIEEGTTHTNFYGETITYNAKQQEFVDLGSEGNNCILIGAAGTGKTTCMQGTVENLIHTGAAGILSADSHKHLMSGTPGIVVVSYTRRAVNNIRAAMPDDMKANCITVHKLLEYAPIFYEYEDEDTGELKKAMVFEPTRNAERPLPTSIKTVIVEEASMLSLELYRELIDALGHSVQWILLGDINQLPPVFGSAILGYKLLQWDVIELTEVYRQALESPIIRLAHRILSGKPVPLEEFESFHVPGQLTVHPWKKKLKDDMAVRTLAAFFTRSEKEGLYNVETDMILLPFNKACGTLELNKYIANHLARKYDRTTYEVMAGFNKLYFSVGDKVLYDKEDAEIVEIKPNMGYSGGRVQPESKSLDYWGYNKNQAKDRLSSVHPEDLDVDALLEEVANSDERVRQASHVITLRLLDSDTDVSINGAADVNALIHGYALTVHKSQGSEWDKVFLCFHQSHATMMQREVLYTAVTRAKKELYIICEPDSLVKGINNQKIKGDTLEAKAEHFKGKLDNIEPDLLTYIHKG